MKKIIFSLLVLGAIAILPFSVNAEEVQPSDFNDQRNVTVGDVDTTVYSVNIEWGNFSYDWKYNKTTNKFEFIASIGCSGYEHTTDEDEYLPSLKEDGALYSDDQCTIQQTEDLVVGTTYYSKTDVAGRIFVGDSSINGRIKVAVEFTPSQNYNWVSGKFYGDYSLTPSAGAIQYTNEIVDGHLPLYMAKPSRAFGGWLKLDVNDNYAGEKTVETGATIGTVTLSISDDTN